MTKHLQDLLDVAKRVVSRQKEKEQQRRRSFAYGNTKFENSRITLGITLSRC